MIIINIFFVYYPETFGRLIADIEFAKGLARKYKKVLMRKTYQPIHSFCQKNIQTVEENIFSKIESLSNVGYTFDEPSE
ncbi:uncharacterized protein LOC115033914 isoform X3 [Acyrthosiphon pisum]|uniref:Uncharacterized protein n=1 Tax=Acyrthosiphon pisum TaxID=7029 RepID=A0A8R2JQI7_ACYPI|nr:uncharacterized protein LOC115033914 isoform X3 [Acyrthosiphon pisum]